MKRLLALAGAAALMISGAIAAAPQQQPQHVMSLNLCTDQLILQLLPPERIASVSYLSRVPGYAFLTAEALRVPINYATSEEVLRQNPDLVIAGTTSTPAVRALLKRRYSAGRDPAARAR
jgi:iron complex transport system substrate-binding protein